LGRCAPLFGIQKSPDDAAKALPKVCDVIAGGRGKPVKKFVVENSGDQYRSGYARRSGVNPRTMSNIQERLLESKMTDIEQARSWSPRVISKFETLIRSGDDLSLYRVNPLAFARDRSIAEAESIHLFLHATRSGLFEMSWDVVCPQSGMVLDSFGALRTLKTHYVCGLCDVSGETDLDDFIEVTFTVSPQLRRLPFHDPDSLSVEDFHWKLRFLNDARIPGQQVRFLDYLHGLVRGLAFLPPESITTMRADVGPGALAGVNVRTQAALMVTVAGERTTTPTLLPIKYDGQRFLPSLSMVPPGPIVIEAWPSESNRNSSSNRTYPAERCWRRRAFAVCSDRSA
jgi:hypothetical protein